MRRTAKPPLHPPKEIFQKELIRARTHQLGAHSVQPSVAVVSGEQMLSNFCSLTSTGTAWLIRTPRTPTANKIKLR